MLFSTYSFLLIFLPALLLVYQICALILKERFNPAVFLFVGSSLFIAIGDIFSLALLLLSLAINYAFLLKISHIRSQKKKNILLAAAIAFNLGYIGVFKYADFFFGSFGYVLGFEVSPLNVSLPLAISFYTFQLIAIQVDCWRGRLDCPRVQNLAMFVSFFPQLIAGPIVRYEEVKTEIESLQSLKLDNISKGLSFLFLGLFKKVAIADSISPHADKFFNGVGAGASPDFVEAWFGALLYTFQIYFDFSGYSDMAIGIALIFGIRLPLNFNSPYKAASIIDFWRRWHMTLSRFLRDFLYVPLGGNRDGALMRWRNVFITMLLGGLWHGASWNFVLWGGMHGLLIGANHLWRRCGFQIPLFAGWAVTFLAVVLTWVAFRTTDLDTAARIYAGMLGLNGVSLPERFAPLFLPLLADIDFVRFQTSELLKVPAVGLTCLAMLIAFAAPNTQQFLHSQTADVYRWRQVVACTIGGCIAMMGMFQPVEFVYFRF